MCIKQIAFAGNDETSVAKTLLATGQVAHEIKDYKTARQHYGDCIAMLTRLTSENNDTEGTEPLATTLHELGRLRIDTREIKPAPKAGLLSLGKIAALAIAVGAVGAVGFALTRRN